MRNMFVTPEISAHSVTPATLDTTDICISCLARPVYPHWMGRVMHPKFQNIGSSRYDLRTDVTPWRHDDQKDGKTLIRASVVYDYLETRDELKTCLGLLDAVEIQKKGAKVFRDIFGDTALLFFPRSAIESRSRIRYVPYLCISSNEVKDRWYWLGRRWHKHYRVLRFS